MNSEILDLEENQSELLPNHQRAKHAKTAFLLLLVAVVLLFMTNLYQLNILDNLRGDVFYTDEELDFNDSLVGLASLLYVAVNIACIVYFLKWMRRLYANGERAKLKMQQSDKMVIWNFFIPIVSLFRPYQMMVEISNKMDSVIKRVSNTFVRPSVEGILGLWWTMFIVNNILSRIHAQYSKTIVTVDDYFNDTIYALIINVVDMVAILVTILMISKVSAEEVEFRNCIEVEEKEEHEIDEVEEEVL